MTCAPPRAMSFDVRRLDEPGLDPEAPRPRPWSGRGRSELHRRARLVGLLLLTFACRPSASGPKDAGAPSALEQILGAGPSEPIGYLEDRAPQGEARRIVSLSPVHTEILFALGAEARVVGVSRFSDVPAKVKDWPQVGGLTDLSVEQVLGLEPDVVVAVPGKAYLDRLRALVRAGVSVLVLPTSSIGDGFAGIQALGKLADSATTAEALTRSVKSSLRSRASSKPDRALRAAVVYGWSPLFVAGPGSFPDQLLTVVGASNAVDAGAAWAQWSPEALLAANPDLLVNAAGAPPPPGLDALAAIAEGRVYDAPASSLFRPGPRLAEAAEQLAELIRRAAAPHP